jgi:hypothetical protein
MIDPTLTKAAAKAGTPATLGKAPAPAPARIYAPDFGDRLRALQKTAGYAAMGSARHWRRLARLDAATKQVLWATLPPELKAQLKAARASLESQGGDW